MPLVFSQSELIWLLLLCVPVLVQWVYYWGFFSALFPKNVADSSLKSKPVSIIVCCKNEVENLKILIPLLLSQQHPDFEIIIVNDGSWDDSHLVIEEFRKTAPLLKTIYIDPVKKIQAGKKMAITLGIKAAQKEYLVFTDADCRPASDQWLANLSAGLEEKKQVVLGYSPYQKEKGLLNYFIRFETQLTAIFYLSFAKRGRPYMAVGRNWAYSKAIFYEAKGFSKHHYIMAGDDDLLLQNIAPLSKVNTVINPASFVYSIPKKSWKKWIEQKRRHLQVGKHYTLGAKLTTGIFSLSYFVFFTLLILAFLFNIKIWAWLLLIAGIRLIFNWISFAICSKKLEKATTAWLFPFAELMMMAYWFGIGFYVFFSKKREW